MTLTLLPGDALAQLRTLETASVHLCVTSPNPTPERVKP